MNINKPVCPTDIVPAFMAYAALIFIGLVYAECIAHVVKSLYRLYIKLKNGMCDVAFWLNM